MPDDTSNTDTTTSEGSDEEEDVENKADDYTGYWEDAMKDESYEKSQDHPTFHVYVSYQKSGTETEAEHYDDQDNQQSTDTTTSTTDTTTTDDTTTTE